MEIVRCMACPKTCYGGRFECPDSEHDRMTLHLWEMHTIKVRGRA